MAEYHRVRVHVTFPYTGYYIREDRETRQTALREGWGFICG